MSAAPRLELRIGRLVVDAACGADAALLAAAVDAAVRQALEPAMGARAEGSTSAQIAHRDATPTQRVAGAVAAAVLQRAAPALGPAVMPAQRPGSTGAVA